MTRHIVVFHLANIYVFPPHLWGCYFLSSLSLP